MSAKFTKFQQKAAEVEILSRLDDVLQEYERDRLQTYKCVGKHEDQARDWRTNELLWEDEEKTVPMYRDRYENVPKEEEELTDEDRAYCAAVQLIRNALEKLL